MLPGAAQGSRAGWALWPAPWLAALVLVAGCESFFNSKGVVQPGSVPAMEHPMLPGLPVPPGFALDDKRSSGWTNGELRQANCTFTGDLAATTVNAFYKEHMPDAGFTLRQERFEAGEYVLDFDGKSEFSTVRVKRERTRTVLKVDVTPAQAGGEGRAGAPQRSSKRPPPQP